MQLNRIWIFSIINVLQWRETTGILLISRFECATFGASISTIMQLIVSLGKSHIIAYGNVPHILCLFFKYPQLFTMEIWIPDPKQYKMFIIITLIFFPKTSKIFITPQDFHAKIDSILRRLTWIIHVSLKSM